MRTSNERLKNSACRIRYQRQGRESVGGQIKKRKDVGKMRHINSKLSDGLTYNGLRISIGVLRSKMLRLKGRYIETLLWLGLIVIRGIVATLEFDKFQEE